MVAAVLLAAPLPSLSHAKALMFSLLAEIANTAVLMASDNASAITAAVINTTCGEIAD
jgi:hypothetical protein